MSILKEIFKGVASAFGYGELKFKVRVKHAFNHYYYVEYSYGVTNWSYDTISHFESKGYYDEDVEPSRLWKYRLFPSAMDAELFAKRLHTIKDVNEYHAKERESLENYKKGLEKYKKDKIKKDRPYEVKQIK